MLLILYINNTCYSRVIQIHFSGQIKEIRGLVVMQNLDLFASYLKLLKLALTMIDNSDGTVFDKKSLKKMGGH